MTNTIKDIPLGQLKLHPRNMRKHVTEEGIAELAASIKATRLLQPLVVVPDTAPASYLVVVGERRLRALRLNNARTAPCTIASMAEAEQRLAMISENKQREDIDPISEALHYQALVDDGCSVKRISAETGVSTVMINSRLALLALDPEIREFVADGRITKSADVARAICAIPDKATRIALATRFARDGAVASAILATCKRVMDKLGAEAPRKTPGRPPAATTGVMANLAAAHTSATSTLAWNAVRAGANAMCHSCAVRAYQLKSTVAEPAWSLVTASANAVCGACDVRALQGACGACPGVELIRTLIVASRANPAAEQATVQALGRP